jgi:8-oxo-dGTP pyrophosphatase MutT (NUDIX family)
MARPNFDPEALPIVTEGPVLPAIAPERLTAEGLRACFAHPPAVWEPEATEAPLSAFERLREAAVLVPLVLREEGITVLLTQRTAHLNHHGGQISFPGGRREAIDIDSAATALREAREEIALAAEHVEVLGAMPEYVTGTGFRVTPVVALVHPPFTVHADTFEVAEIFEVPLAFLMNPAHHEVRLFTWSEGERRFFAMPYPSTRAAGPYFIWGATAGMLRNLYRFLSAA